ncbi:acyltransferase domain-containing protein [Streptomyces griseoloalbus]|uniref:acyltransferase domain-containing protein n=1 Tax=Streptomyces griseoloalbus TaxID=67303 RepID=UPI0033B1FDC0
MVRVGLLAPEPGLPGLPRDRTGQRPDRTHREDPPRALPGGGGAPGAAPCTAPRHAPDTTAPRNRLLVRGTRHPFLRHGPRTVRRAPGVPGGHGPLQHPLRGGQRRLGDGTRRGQDFDDILQTHAALYSIGWSLTEALRDEGFRPDAVLGQGLGEYVAATVAGAMSVEDGLDLVMKQACLVKQRCRTGGMLGVLAGPGLYHRRRELFGGLSLAGVNCADPSAGHFVVSGPGERLTVVRAALDEEGVVAVPLPVPYALHSAFLDEVRHECRSVGRSRCTDPACPSTRRPTPGRWGTTWWTAGTRTPGT